MDLLLGVMSEDEADLPRNHLFEAQDGSGAGHHRIDRGGAAISRSACGDHEADAFPPGLHVRVRVKVEVRVRARVGLASKYRMAREASGSAAN